MAFLSFFVSHWTLFIVAILGVVGLCAAAWFLKNWKLALAAIVLTVVCLAYQSASMEGYKRRINEEAQAQVKLLTARLGVLQLTQALDAQRATSDAYLNSQLDTLSRDTPHNDSACLDLNAAHRVWAVRSAKPLAAPVSARRPTSLLPWRHPRS